LYSKNSGLSGIIAFIIKFFLFNIKYIIDVILINLLLFYVPFFFFLLFVRQKKEEKEKRKKKKEKHTIE
jgi:phosphotransferase system  glucose/maltose/N-acetylglucosamine-specific IIC component